MANTADQDPDEHNPVFVYIMCAGAASYPRAKIGFSANPRARLTRMQTGSPFRIRLVQAWRLDSRAMAVEVERDVHQRLHERHCHGEWFRCQEHVAMRHLHDALRERGLLQSYRSLACQTAASAM